MVLALFGGSLLIASLDFSSSSQSTGNPDKEKSKHFNIYAYSKFLADRSFLVGMNQGDNVEVNLTEEAAEEEENAFERLINEVSYQNLRNHSLKTRERILTE